MLTLKPKKNSSGTSRLHEGANAKARSASRFATRTADERHAALRPFQSVLPDTPPDALTPSLEELDDRFQKLPTQIEAESDPSQRKTPILSERAPF